MCVSAAEAQKCELYGLKEDCEQTAGCTWQSHGVFCRKSDAPVVCLKIGHRRQCQSTPGCSWDVKTTRCRTVHVTHDEL